MNKIFEFLLKEDVISDPNRIWQALSTFAFGGYSESYHKVFNIQDEWDYYLSETSNVFGG